MGLLHEVMKDRNFPDRQQQTISLISQIREVNAQIVALSPKKRVMPEPSWMEDKHLREINDSLTRRTVKPLVCPKCKTPDRGNVMNGEPFCFKCNLPLSEKYVKPLEDWRKHSTFKPLEAV